MIRLSSANDLTVCYYSMVNYVNDLFYQGDTLENVSNELECIMKTGQFKLVIMPKRITGTSKMDHESTIEHNSGVFLDYEPAREVYLQRRRLQTLSESHDDFLLPVVHVERQFSCISERWNNEQIDDFVRKLGFLEAQSVDVDQRVKLFQQLNQVIHHLVNCTALKLHDA